MKAYIWSNGCLDNYLHEVIIRIFLSKNGYAFTKNIRNADLIILNTCAFTQDKENGSFDQVKYVAEIKKKRAVLIVGGCLPAINRERLATIFQGPTFSLTNINALDSILPGTKYKIKDISALDVALAKKEHPHPEEKPIKRTPARRLEEIVAAIYEKHYARDYLGNVFPIKISTGCLGICSYCSERTAKGRLKSRRENQILKDFKAGLKGGFSKFVLVADDLGAYGQDLKGTDIIRLLSKMVKIKGGFKIGLRNFNPEWMLKYEGGLINVLKSGKISWIITPIQSGSDKILNLMRRKYKIGAVKKCLINIRNLFPEIKIITHILVGFPGETAKDFNETLKMMEAVKFNLVYFYRFQGRPRTLAPLMTKQISDRVKRARFFKACAYWLSLLSESGFNY